MGIPFWKSALFFSGIFLFAAYLFPTQRELGLFYSKSHYFDQARFYLEKQFHRDPGDVRNSARYLEALLYQGEYILLQRAGGELIRKFPQEASFHSVMAKYYEAILDFSRASEYWLKILDLQKHVILRPKAEESQNEILRSAQDDVDDIRDQLISYYSLEKDFGRLISFYESRIARGEWTADFFQSLGRIYLLRKMAQEAERVYRDWMAREPGALEPRLRLAEICEFTGRPERALALYREIADKYPDDRAHSVKLIEKLVKYRKEEAALEAINAFLARYPEDETFLDILSELHRRLGQRQQAIDLLTNLYERYPAHLRFLKAIGEIYYEMGENLLAKEYLGKYHEKKDGDYRSHHVYGDVLAALGDSRASRREYEKALSLIRERD